MRLKSFKLIPITFFILLGCARNSAQGETSQIADFNQLSEHFLSAIKDGKDTQQYQDQLASTTLKAMEKGLETDNQKLAFWVNIYNAYIQVILAENPGLYEDRQAFFNEDRIRIAGEKIAFSKIEHGIIRKSQWSLGLGRIGKLFVDKFERKLRVDERDYRIHFALNCGAKDCPPVAIYKADRLEEQFTKGTVQFLKKSTEYDEKNKKVAVTSLFNWFRGDFGNKKGIKKILKNQGLIPTTEDIDITYKNYDWTLELDNWTEL